MTFVPRTIFNTNFLKIVVLDLWGNELAKIEEEVCRNLLNVKKFDCRNNKLTFISPHIKAMMQLTVLRLDHNELAALP